MTPARNVEISAWHNGFYGEAFYFTESDAPVDLTGYAGKLEVRHYGAQPGSAIITLGNVASAIEGVRIAEPQQGLIEIRIEEATLGGAYSDLRGGVEPGQALDLLYDLVLTAPTGDDEVWITGKFTINAGATL